MRFLFGLLALIGAAFAFSLSATAAAPDWQAHVTKTADGGFLVGNPNAKVKLVEYMSYTCPHCAAFSRESASVLRGQMIKSGSVSLEERNMVRDQLDLAAALLARCAGPAGFDKLSTTFFAQQDTWLNNGIQWEQNNSQRMAMYPKDARLKAAAEGAGISAIARANGMSQAQIDACLADPAGLAQITTLLQHVPQGITGTPGFLIDGKLQRNVYNWATLEPALRAAGAR
ncbi:thioredoxin domain-containing protein [Hephaestia mangrovi]|uniref:thioredoxin domain-containing protein n=1 Tax=Hephaestia mangrovi TaxID=2873268 RepID=UPI001CA735B7|nr:thioredoxin domain-containing protein [Hephaestia mangrovi]MBY8826714.1 DsbA family protein [Hephaestia mangrovi]